MILLPYFFLVPLISSYVIRDRRDASLSNYGPPPGIGFHLTTSYAIAAIRYPNGTAEDLLRVEAGTEYKALISRMANPLSRRKCQTQWEKFQCSIAHTKRQLNKHLGRPATEDIGILARFLLDINAAVEKKLGFATTHKIFPVFPILPALEEEDIQDAFEYADLDWLLAERRSYHTYWETNAAYAGVGYGLCKSTTNLERCEDEERDMRLERVLFLNFDDSSFRATLQPMQNAYWDYIDASTLHLDLGRSQLPDNEVDRARFWASIQEAIVDVGSTLTRPPNKVILIGEHADDPDFAETVKEAIWELIEFDASFLLEANAGTDSMILAARGAAELAGRAQYWESEGEGNEQQEFAGELR
ncbi:hypothetical protein K469DRAFT_625359 [Zopfia rhizophila CBS 207.26]|uniref:Uncharacterized protein n=1 Tax=Zopfia rhizophila CBS 207.26 TaxID=1314779 RepID=A0A6A6EIA1_9PEZI|nr:hypothetical protein K469DRAFT_625359 [Zopfia rhizophila CBS 207.26]